MMLAIFHGCWASGRAGFACLAGEALGVAESHRGGNLRSCGADALNNQAEQEFDIDPCEDRIITFIGQFIEPTERLPSFVEKFYLPAQAIRFNASRGGQTVR